MHALFEDIAWSTDTVAAQTVERAAEIGLPVHVLPEWYDVDDCEGDPAADGGAAGGARLFSQPALKPCAALPGAFAVHGFGRRSDGAPRSICRAGRQQLEEAAA